MNQLILGDCLEVLKRLESASVDLIYLDPPFFSNRNYEVIWGDEGEIRSFQDRWAGGIDHYIAWLKDRVQEMHRVLKPTGSIFLHCDWHANAYIRVLILDKVFGEKNFRGEVIWQRTNAHNDARKKLASLTDTIWYYSKTGVFTYNLIYSELETKYLKNAYRFEDARGAYTLSDLTGAGATKGDSSVAWRGCNPAGKGRHWAIPGQLVGEIVGKEEAKQLSSVDKLDLLYEKGLIIVSKHGVPRYKKYLESAKGTLLGNIWSDIQNVQAQAKERIGYPTQKPEALLERIIKMASNEGDIVLDPFVGGGTTVVVAERLNRRWLGIDQSVSAIKVSDLRLYQQRNKSGKENSQ